MTQKWYTSQVIHGNKDGSKYAYPTVNLDPSLPSPDLERGVYASWVKIGEQQFPGAAYFGPRAIKNETVDVFEVYILDFSAEIYGQEVSVSLEQFIRGVMDFTDFSALKDQITQDIKMVEKALHVSEKNDRSRIHSDRRNSLGV